MNKSNQAQLSKKNNVLCFINPLKNNVMNKSNQVQPSKKNNVMNKLIMGLSCLGVLSTVSCDNDKKEQKIAPHLEKVTFSAKAMSNLVSNQDGSPDGDEAPDFKIEAGDKVTLYIVEGDEKSTTAASYYKEGEIIGTEFPEDGKEFEFVKDKDDKSGDLFTLKDGFYLEAEGGDGKEYTITKFDITKKNGTTYDLKQYQSFNMLIGSPTKVDIEIKPKIEPSATGDTALESLKFSIHKSKSIAKNNTFRATFKKMDGTLFNSKKDKGTVIHLTVKNGDYVIYDIPNLFEATGDKDGTKAYKIFTITVPREISYYKDFNVVATVNIPGLQLHKFKFNNQNYEFTITNNDPVIHFKGADGKGKDKDGEYSTKLNVNTNEEVTIFELTDKDNDSVYANYHWETFDKSGNLLYEVNYQTGVVNPHKIFLATGVSIDSTVVKVTIKAHDDMGAKATLTKEFTFADIK